MKNYNLQELLQKPVCMMQGDEFVFLLSNLSLLGKQETKQVESKPKNLVYGIQGIADTFGCSIPTANRIKRSGVIDDAITQVGRKIVVDADLALELTANAKKNGKEVASRKRNFMPSSFLKMVRMLVTSVLTATSVCALTTTRLWRSR